MRVGKSWIAPDLKDGNFSRLATFLGEHDIVGHHVEHIARAIGPRQIGRVWVDQPAAIPHRATQRALAIDRTALACSLVTTALVGALSEFFNGNQLATELAVPAAP